MSSSNQDHDDELLTWFSKQSIPMLETRLMLGNLEYFHFSSLFNLADGRKGASFGSAFERKSAALKCVGEALERQAMVQFFIKNEMKIPKAFRNSNGWAVHTSQANSARNARNEVVERHLLMKSYFKFGWQGLNFVQTIKSGDIDLTLLTSHFTTPELVAGMVIAQSKKYPGISIGHCVGQKSEVKNADFWQSAIFEAADKLLLMRADADIHSVDSSSWIQRESAELLKNKFDMDLMSFGSGSTTEEDVGEIVLCSVDLAKDLNLDFPLFATFARGDALIPLFQKSELDEMAFSYLWPILRKNGVLEIPERHPIL